MAYTPSPFSALRKRAVALANADRSKWSLSPIRWADMTAGGREFYARRAAEQTLMQEPPA